jgi:hypothetical protein
MCGHMHDNILNSGDYNQKTLIEDMTNYQSHGNFSARKLYIVYKNAGTVIRIIAKDIYIFPYQSFGPEIIVYQNDTKIGITRGGNSWVLDVSGNGAYGTDDVISSFGKSGDVYVTGDWNGDGKTEIGVVRNDNEWVHVR